MKYNTEYTISIVKKSNFDQWKNGEQYARCIPGVCEEFKKTWGNFWSKQTFWAFNRLTKDELKQQNRELFEKAIKKETNQIKKYIKSTEDEKSINYYNEKIASYKDPSYYENLSELDKFHYGMWITYNEFQKALRSDDCDSPFVHINETEDVVVFGKYFRS